MARVGFRVGPGPVSYVGPNGGQVGPDTAVAPALKSLPASGLMAVDIWSTNGATHYGTAPLLNVLSATRTRRVNGIGDYLFQVPATDANYAQVVQGREVRMAREGDGELWRGLIEKSIRKVSPGGELVLEVSGRTLAAELAYAGAGVGIPLQNVTPASAFSTLLGFITTDGPATSWTSLIAAGITTPSGLTTMTTRYDGLSVWQCLQDIATIFNGYLRETVTPRQIELKSANAASGLRIVNVEHVDQSIGSNPYVGLITGVPGYLEDGSSIINRVIPFGSPQNGLLFDLAQSNLSSPYSIGTFVPTVPNQVSAATPIETTNAPNSTVQTLSSVVGGPNSQNTLALIFVARRGGNSGGILNLTLGGKTAIKQASIINTNYAVELWYVINPQAKSANSAVDVRCEINCSNIPPAYVTVVYLADVDVTALTLTTHTATGTSTSPSPGAIASDANSVVLSCVSFNAATTTWTKDGAATQIASSADAGSSIGSGIEDKAGAASVNFTDTLSGSVEWAALSVTVSGYKNRYLEDASSVSTYGRRSMVLNNSNLKIGDFSGIQNAANSLYDWSATQLQRTAALVTQYQIDVVGLPYQSWNVGDTIRVQFRGIATDLISSNRVWLDINKDLVVIEATDSYDVGGNRLWNLKFGDVLILPTSLAQAFSKFLQNVGNLNQR